MSDSRLEWTYNGGVEARLGSGRGYQFVTKQLTSPGYIGSGVVSGKAFKFDTNKQGYEGGKFDDKIMEEEEKRERRRRQKAKVVNCCKKFIAFLFSHVGLAGMVVAYSILGGFIFMELEAPAEQQVKHEIVEFKKTLVEDIWQEAVKLHNGTSNRTLFVNKLTEIFVEFQTRLYRDVKDKGWDGLDEHEESDLQWSFAGALLFAVTVITTIGYGHIAPKTKWGRFVTILYALIGIPLTFLYLSNIGNFLADCFRLFYKKICCDVCCCQKCERDKKRERIRIKRLKLAQQRNMLLAQRFSNMGYGPDGRAYLKHDDEDSLCHSLDDVNEAAREFHRSASAPKICSNNGCDVQIEHERPAPKTKRQTSENNSSPVRGAATLPRRSSTKPPSLSLEAPPPYNRPGSLARPPSYRQSVTSTEPLLRDTDFEASVSDLEQRYPSSVANLRETAIVDSDTDEERLKNKRKASGPTFNAGFFDRLGESKETAIVDSDDIRRESVTVEIANDPNRLALPDGATSTQTGSNVPSRSGSNRSARSRSSYTDDIETVGLLETGNKSVSREGSRDSKRSRKDKAKDGNGKEKQKKSKSKEKEKKSKDKKESARASSSKNKRERSKSKPPKRSKSEKRKGNKSSALEDFDAVDMEEIDLRKRSAPNERSKSPRKVLRKNKSTPAFKHNSNKSFKEDLPSSSNLNGPLNEDEEDDVEFYQGSVDSFVTAYSESSMCTQDSDDTYEGVTHPKNGDVSKPQPMSQGPAVSFGGNDDITINTGRRALRHRHTIAARPEHLHLSYLDDPLDFDDDDGGKVTVPIPVCLIIIAGYIFAGSVLFTLWEDWDYLTGSYFCFITLSTIGFGDIVPGMKMNDWGSHQKLVLCALWLAFGLSLLAMCFNLMQEEVKEKVKWVGNKIGLLKDDTAT